MADKETIAFIGTGVMGRSMAGHLLSAGHPLNVFTRSKAKADPLVSQGAVWRNSIAEAAEESEIIITIVGFPADVESVYLGDGGIVANAKAGSLLIDMTTSSPDLAVRIYDEARKKGSQSLDAPVSGGDIGAREARLSIMVGGDAEAFERAKPAFEKMGKNIVLQGRAGSGQHTKMCNQIAIASGMVAICEAMAYAKRSGLDPVTVLKSIESGAAGSWSLTNLAPRFLKGNFDPGFFVKHFIKDMRIALESAERMKLELPGLAQAKKLYEKLAAQGGENFGTQALFKLYD
ncbi:MAG: NAD(P)-dependent oxidoreductase [Verrucomicrobia bacterium]|nr:NAD(P)-dependent oxidoreductase [Verrucomicrobiota bacterium]